MQLPMFTHTRLVLAFGIGAALTACGGDKPADTTATTAGAAAPAPSADELSDVQELTVNNRAEPESLDPHKVSGVPESDILRQMFVGLTTTDPEGNTIPGMAAEWSSEDNKVWIFKLRDANWSNGDPVTAHDFVYSFQRLGDPNTASPYATYLADAKVVNAQAIVDGQSAPDTLGVRAIDDKTLEVTLSEPVPYFPHMLIHTSVKPVHKATVEAFGDKWTSPENIVVNGPYKISQWQVNERIVLERNPAYYDDANTTINKVTLLAIPQATTDVQRYKAGEIDITADDLPPEQYDKLKQELGAQVIEPPKLCTYYFEFNHTKAPFDDVRVRKALSLTLDRDIVVDSILKQGQKVAYQFTPESAQGINNFEPEWKSWDKAKRIEEAKKLLNEAGYNESNPLRFELLYNTNEQHKTLAVASSAFWKENLGFVEVSLNNQEWKTYLETRRKQNHQMARGGWCADYNEASTFLNTFKSDNSSNYGKYNNPEFDALMNKTLLADVSDADRANMYQQAEAILDKDSATIFVYQYTAPRLVKPYVHGFTLNPLGTWQAKDLRITKH
ncbi:ABC transporter substrate-binding protein [Moraxella catarrhalis]|uniref:Oligopeptide ABC transporter, periplasmic oligopeptide-binding protein OppA n=1 Tax=Moraxella catarrhalis TaxID=480 RepID=A0A198UIP3_MORCA|nr:ABC transporter substrate-binding protein [Moraxella catarrhalis]OAU96323.1 Oligopeptide ABC transporter, periplasmic oligopeptide-binding protein OppA [Moraxella catarrhalis]OAU97227.1 Oligopeptide ABC transporter, periplasmic oligopeptide-binding protein OppA [Moraxella catarrhalis]OAV03530.1 Oligopeptide ABC transporter, periplasmic oligopeptide-binding protein OppA [Moraxella catarrhalis]